MLFQPVRWVSQNFRRCPTRWPCWVTVLLLALAQPAWAATTVVVGTDPSKTVIKGTLVTPEQVIDGDLVIEGDTITCVAVTCETPQGATRITVTNAYIFPGFVDAHNHVAYNVLPHWTPPKLYQNRGQWQAAQAYRDFKQPYATLIQDKGLFCEMVKYGEIKALVSGVTTIQGTARTTAAFASSSATPRTRMTSTPPAAISGPTSWTSIAGMRPRAESAGRAGRIPMFSGRSQIHPTQAHTMGSQEPSSKSVVLPSNSLGRPA